MAKYNTKSILRQLMKKHLKGKSSEQEKRFLDRYYHFFDAEKNILEDLNDEKVAEIENKMFENIIAATKSVKTPTKKIKLQPYQQIAAAILLMLGSYAIYQLVLPKQNNPVAGVVAKPTNINQNDVMLTLSDGRMVKLTDIESGKVAVESGTSIEKSADGTIVYTVKSDIFSNASENKYNTISTPNGQLSQISLPDGTKVWLNAESSLKYPIAFNAEKRVVELTGEGYFEVAKNKEKPFIVRAKDTEVEVLGTKFNVSAYTNDNFTKTTLAEGSVSISKEKSSKLLRPNQQALTLENQKDIAISNVDTEEALAWKSGYFMFNNMDIKTVMTMISRWYNIDVEYQGSIENEVFIGTVSRFDNIEKLLSTIELTGKVHFKIINQPNKKSKKVLVTP